MINSFRRLASLSPYSVIVRSKDKDKELHDCDGYFQWGPGRGCQPYSSDFQPFIVIDKKLTKKKTDRNSVT